MKTLDPLTVERLARLIVDQDGPYERRGWELEKLLCRAGWPDPPEYDGSARIWWITEQMNERSASEVAQLVCRLCDPLEYDEGMRAAELFRGLVNGLLQHEQLMVSYVGGRPVIGELGTDGASPVFSEPDNLEERLRALVADDDTVSVLLNRVSETRICQASGAYTFAIIGIGSLVEGLLLAMLTERDANFREHGLVTANGKKTPPERVSLHSLIDVAHAKEWVQLDATSFMHQIREFRNFVHPRKELAEQPRFDADSVALCWGPVQALLNDLERANH